MPSLYPRRILSIQSHVSSGYVGNKAAVFPLQLLGYDVDVINSCLLSNHTGYSKGAPGICITGEDLSQNLKGMKSNGLLKQISHLLTGYMGTASCLTALVDAVTLLRTEASSSLTFVCDPVLGDNGKLYVPEQLVGIYIDKVLSHADVLIPNVFELSLLSKSILTSEHDAFNACKQLQETHKICSVIVTGARFQDQGKTLSVLVSSRSTNSYVQFAIDTDYINGSFTGSGDLMSALLLAWMDKIPDDPVLACSNAMASVSAVLLDTANHPFDNAFCRMPELRLIQNQNAILHPPTHLLRVRKIY